MDNLLAHVKKRDAPFMLHKQLIPIESISNEK